MTGETLKIKTSDNKEYNGFLMKPAGGSGPGLILIQEIFGINEHIRDVADLYAREGFVVLAPDVFWRLHPDLQLGYSDKDLTKGFEIYQKSDMSQILSDLVDAALALRTVPGVTPKVGSIGYCMGGLLSFKLAAKGAVDAAVCYYGGGMDQALGEAGKINCPVLMHFGENDHYIPMDAVDKIRKTFERKTDVSIYVYKGADHGFNCDQRPSYDRKSAMLAYARSAAFLHQYLG